MKKDVFETAEVTFKIVGRSGAEQVFHTGTRRGCTPAEFKVMQVVHQNNVRIIKMTDSAKEMVGYDEKGAAKYRPRTMEQELDRLRSHYGKNTVARAFPGEFPDLPYTFRQARISTKDVGVDDEDDGYEGHDGDEDEEGDEGAEGAAKGKGGRALQSEVVDQNKGKGGNAGAGA